MTPYPSGIDVDAIFAGLQRTDPSLVFDGSDFFPSHDFGTLNCGGGGILDPPLPRAQGGQYEDALDYHPLVWTDAMSGRALGDLDTTTEDPWVLVIARLRFPVYLNGGSYYNACVGPIDPQFIAFDNTFPDGRVAEWVRNPLTPNVDNFFVAGSADAQAYLARPAGDTSGYPNEPSNPYTPLLWRASEIADFVLSFTLKSGSYSQGASGAGYLTINVTPMIYRDGWGPVATRFMCVV